MKNEKTKVPKGSWIVSSIIVGTALGVVLGNLVWWLSGSIILGLITELAGSRRRQSEEKETAHKDVA